jgi:polar amino acid transport system ATP-binding protein
MSANSGGPLVKVRDLHKSFGQNEVLRGVDLDVKRGEVVSVIGASGSGKTTMLRCVNLLETYDSGSITVDGVEVGYSGEGSARRRRGERELARIRADIGMVFQLFNLFPHLTARENVMLGLRKVRRLGRNEAGEIADRWLARVGLAAKRDSLPYELSGGQQQRVGIARAVAMNPKVLLLDEITSALDPELVNEVLSVVRSLAEGGMTLMMVTHEMRFAREVCDRVVFMHQGKVHESGPPERVFADPQTPELQQFLGMVA